MNEYNNLQKKIRSLSLKEKEELLKKLNYKKIEKGLIKLEEIANNSLEEYLNKGGFDFHYTSKDLLLHLAKILKLDDKKLQEEISKIEDFRTKLNNTEDPYIYVKSECKANSFSSAVILSQWRYIKLKKHNLIDKNIEKVLEDITYIIKKHYKKNKGTLPCGKILGYEYYHLDGSVFKFDVSGNSVEN